MTSISRTLRTLAGGFVAAIVVLASAAPAAEAQTTPDEESGPILLHACYIPGSGVVYRTSPDGADPALPDACKSRRHVPFSWNSLGMDGEDGADGLDGFHCWDTNQNGVADDEEDRNGDGAVDVLDCLGAGTPGSDGEDGEDGEDGADGADGSACWDLNGNGVGDPEEDVDGSGTVDVLDCRGPQGAEGAEGPEGPEGPQGPQGPVGSTQCRVPGASPTSPFGEMGGSGTTPVTYAPARIDLTARTGTAAAPRASDPFIGEMMLVPYNFAPRNWAFSEGQLLSIASHTALFSLLGTTYGGDGRTTFGVPDMRGLEPVCGMHWVIALEGVFPSRS